MLDVRAPGGAVWEIGLVVDDQTLAEGDGFTQFAGWLPYEGIDVGIDRRSPVSWDLYELHGPYPFTGRLGAVSFVPGDFAPDAGPVLVEQAMSAGIGLE